jgi:hypothetical protein
LTIQVLLGTASILFLAATVLAYRGTLVSAYASAPSYDECHHGYLCYHWGELLMQWGLCALGFSLIVLGLQMSWLVTALIAGLAGAGIVALGCNAWLDRRKKLLNPPPTLERDAPSDTRAMLAALHSLLEADQQERRHVVAMIEALTKAVGQPSQ